MESDSRKPFRKRHKKKVIAALAVTGAVLGVIFLGGCAKFTEPYKDAPRSQVDNGAPVDLVRNADGFSNLSTKCDHGNRIYVVYHGDAAYGAVAVVPQDPTCGRTP